VSSKRSKAPALHLTDLIRKVLADGAVHFELEVLLAILKIVPPEQAVRRGDHRKVKEASRTERSLEKQMMLGVRAMAQSTVSDLVKKGEIERTKRDGKRAYRLIDEEQLAWNRAVAARFGGNGGAPTLRPEVPSAPPREDL